MLYADTVYAFTLRRVTDPSNVTKDRYRSYLTLLLTRLKIKLVEVYFETTHGLHCHGTFRTTEEVQEKRLRCRGWNLKVNELYNEDGWKKYIQKDQKFLEMVNGELFEVNRLPDTPISDCDEEQIKLPIKKLFKDIEYNAQETKES